MGRSNVYKWPWENWLNYTNWPKTWLPTARRIYQPKKKYVNITSTKIKWKIKQGCLKEKPKFLIIWFSQQFWRKKFIQLQRFWHPW